MWAAAPILPTVPGSGLSPWCQCSLVLKWASGAVRPNISGRECTPDAWCEEGKEQGVNTAQQVPQYMLKAGWQG